MTPPQINGAYADRRYVSHELRCDDAYGRALAEITARHEQHMADIQRTSERLDRVAALLGKVGAV